MKVKDIPRDATEQDIARMEKPEGIAEPSWYFQWGGSWRFYAGYTFNRFVFNVGTPWFDFGYAF